MLNVFFWIILLSMLADYALDLVANIRNLRALRLEPPPELAGLYDADKYRKSQEYTRINTRFGLIAGTAHLAVVLAFWFAGGFAYLDRIVSGLGYPFIVNGLLYIGILVALNGLISLPFGIYHTFVIEQRFGFNRMTPGTYVSDLAKGLFLGILLGAPVIAGFLLLFDYFGQTAWIYSFIGLVVFTLAVQYVTPVLIMPLFNKFTPLQNEGLKKAIMDYAASVGYRVGHIFVMNGSKRSTRANAFFTGFGRYKRIALFDTLIEQLTTAEIVGVLAHEIGHYKFKHVFIGMALSVVQTGILLFLLSVFLYSPGLYQAFGMDTMPIYAGLVFFSLLFTPLEMVFSVVSEVISRRDESQADRFAAMTAPEPEGLVTALKKLSINNLSNLTPDPFYVFLTYSHPPLLTRINNIRRAEAARKSKADRVPAASTPGT